MERPQYGGDQKNGDGLDGVRAYLIARGNLAMFVSVLIVGGLLWGYYERAGKIGGAIAVFVLVLVTLSFYDLSSSYERAMVAIRDGQTPAPNGASAQEQKKRHKKLIALIVCNFFVVSGLGFFTGGVVNSPISPYILAMTLLGQYLAVKGTTRVLLGFYGIALYVLMSVGAWLMPSEAFIKPYATTDAKPIGAFLLTALVNFGIGMHVHKNLEAQRSGQQGGRQTKDTEQ